MRKKKIIKNMRKLEGIKCVAEASKKVLKEGWQKELAQIEQRKNDSSPEHEKMQKMSQTLQSLEDKWAQSKKTRSTERV